MLFQRGAHDEAGDDEQDDVQQAEETAPGRIGPEVQAGVGMRHDRRSGAEADHSARGSKAFDVADREDRAVRGGFKNCC